MGGGVGIDAQHDTEKGDYLLTELLRIQDLIKDPDNVGPPLPKPLVVDYDLPKIAKLSGATGMDYDALPPAAAGH